MNKAILMGRLTGNPEMRTTPAGVSVCTFTMAVNRRFRNSAGDYDADFINCVAWRNTAEFISKNFSKGKMLSIVGTIQTRTYEKDGQKRYVTEVIAEEAYFTGEKKEADTSANLSAPTPKEADTPADIFNGFIPKPSDDDLPF